MSEDTYENEFKGDVIFETSLAIRGACYSLADFSWIFLRSDRDGFTACALVLAWTHSCFESGKDLG